MGFGIVSAVRVCSETACLAAPTAHAHSKRLTSISPFIPMLQASFIQNKTQTLVAGALGAGANVLEFVPPLKTGLEAQAATTAAQLADTPFNPATADWAKIYTGFPQGPGLNKANLGGPGDMKCLSNYAICAFANCTITFASNPPVAECGCLSVIAGQVQPNRPNGFPLGSPFNIATAEGILDKKLKEASRIVCDTPGKCAPPPTSVSAFVAGPQYNTAPFCEAMQPSASSGGKPIMFGGKFDLISTFAPSAWLPSDSSGNQGSPGGSTQCTNGGAFAYCETAACIQKTSWNGLDTTCYCPVYTPAAGTNFSVEGAGATCSGQSVGGKLTFLQNGAFTGAL